MPRFRGELVLLCEKVTEAEIPVFRQKIPILVLREFSKVHLLSGFSRQSMDLGPSFDRFFVHSVFSWSANYRGANRRLMHVVYFFMLLRKAISYGRRKEAVGIANSWSHTTLGLVTTFASMITGKPSIIFVTGDPMTIVHSLSKRKSYRARLSYAIFSRLEKFVFEKAAVIWTLSESLNSASTRKLRHKITVLHEFNNIAASACKDAPKTMQFHSPLEILYVGRLEPEKNVETLLRALTAVKDCHCTIIGEGSMRNALEEMARVLLVLPKVTFTGLLEPSKIRQEMQASDIIVLPSYTEYSPNVLIEAASIGLLIVCSKLRNIEMLLGEDAAFYFPPDDWVQLSKMIEMIVKDPSAVEKVTRRARLKICADYSEDAVRKTVESALTSLEKRSTIR